MSASSAHLQTGSVFAGYRIEGLAGEGGMGVVYRASQVALDRQVALKLIVPRLADDTTFRERFKRESQLGASIEHPNVIPVYEAGEADGLLFICMRWVEGTDLRSLIIREGRLDPARAISIVEQVGAALDAAHRHGLVHRDVKPANVLLASEAREHAYLTDFGLTKRATSAAGLTGTGQFVGTIDYMPPEQIRGERADARADVYSLGCLLYHSLTGHTPYERDSDVATIYAHLADPPPRVVDGAPGAPPGLDEVVRRALAKEPNERYPSAGDLARAAGAALAGEAPELHEQSLARGAAAPAAVRRGGQESPDTEAPEPTMPAAAGPTEPAAAPARTFQTPSPTSERPRTPAGDRPAAAPPAPAARGRRRGAIGLASVLALGAVAGVIGLTGAFGGDEGKDTATKGGEQTVPVEEPADEPAETPAAPKVVAEIPAGNGPDGLAVDGEIVWVANARADTLTPIDATTNKATGDPVPVGRNPDGVAAADGVVWVTNTDDGSVTRIETERNQGASTTVSVGAQPEGIALADRFVWVANSGDGTVTRIDRASATVVGAPIRVGARPIGVSVGKKVVWVANSGDRTVTRIDRSTAEVIGEPIAVGRNARGVTEGLGFVWVSNTDDDTITRLDPASGEPVGDPIRVGDRPKEIAINGGLAWVVNEFDNSVSRIDPKSGEPVGDPIAVGKAPLGIASGAGSLWVANFEADTVTRIRLSAG